LTDLNTRLRQLRIKAARLGYVSVRKSRDGYIMTHKNGSASSGSLEALEQTTKHLLRGGHYTVTTACGRPIGEGTAR
jgi:hypothetical protein